MNQPTILLISTDRYQSRIIYDMLSQAGYQVQISGPGSAGLEMVQVMKPELLLLDWKLPDLDSLEIIHMLRSEERTAVLPIVLIGNMGIEDRLSGLEAGADLCLDGLPQRNVLVARLRALMRRVHPQRPSCQA